MASANNASSDEEEMARPLVKRHRSVMKTVVCSSDEENNVQNYYHTPSTNDNGSSGTRRSQRKRQRKFRIPRREEQWNAISSLPTSHCLSHLKPRKLINDLTKINHRYNYDYTEVSGEESMEEFIVSTDTSSGEADSSASKSTPKAKRQHRVRGYRSRIAAVCDSSEEDEKTESTRQQETAELQTSVARKSKEKEQFSAGYNLLNKNTHENMQKDNPLPNRDLQLRKNALRSSRNKSIADSDRNCQLQTSSEANESARKPTSSKPELGSNGNCQIQTSSFGSECERKPSSEKLVLDSDSDSQLQTTSCATRSTGKSTRRKSALNSDSDDSNPACSQVSRSAAKSARRKLPVDSDSDIKHQNPSSAVLPPGRANTEVERQTDDETDYYEWSEPEGDSQEIKVARKRTKSALDSESDYEPSVTVSGACGTKDDNQQESSEMSKKEGESSHCKSSTTMKCTSSGNSKYTGDSESDHESDSSNDGSESEGSDHEGRIKKLAERKQKQKELLFGQLLSARAKLKKKT